MTEEKKKKKRSPIGCLVTIVIFIIFIVFGVKMMGKMYDESEKSYNKERFDKIIVFFNSSNDYQDLSNIQKKTTAVKLFLLNECRGGDEKLNKLIQFEQNILYKACRIVQDNNIINNFPENNDDIKKFHIKVLNADFKGAVKLYDWYISE